MTQPKPIEDAINQALRYSLRLEDRRGELTDFDVKRLAHEVSSAGNNAMAVAMGDVLVGEIERDFDRLDAAAEHLFSMSPGAGLLTNLSNLLVFAFNPELGSAMARTALAHQGDDVDMLDHLFMNAWFAGDLALCRDIHQRIEMMKGCPELVNTNHFQSTLEILERANLTLSEYRDAIAGFHGVMRSYLAGERNAIVRLNFESAVHEDGYEGIVVEAFLSGLDEEVVDQLDDALVEWAADPEQVSTELSRVVTFLARDVSPAPHVREAC